MDLGDTIAIESGLQDDDFAYGKHSIKITLEEDSATGKIARMGKVKDEQLEEFCILVLASLGYSVRPMDPLI